MKRWWLVIPLLLSVGVNVGILAALASGRLATDRRPPQPPLQGPASGPRSMAGRLGVEAETARELGRLQREFFDSTQEQRRRLGDLRRRLIDEVTAEEPDAAQLEEILQEISTTQLEMERRMVVTTLESRALLDERQEQRYLRQWRERMLRRDGGPPRHGPRDAAGSVRPQRRGSPQR